MACGDRLRWLVVTTSGYNLENPYGTVPLFSDVQEWTELARKVGLVAQGMIDALAPLSVPPHTAWNAANERRNKGVDRYNELPSLFSIDVASDIANAQAAIGEYLCAIELAEDGIVAAGGTPPAIAGSTPTPKTKGPDIPWGPILVVGGIALGIYAWRRAQ